MASQSVGTSAVTGSPTPGRPRDLSAEILESKLHQPTVRPGVIARPRLLARLRAGREVPTITVVAPAGYGRPNCVLPLTLADTADRLFLSRHTVKSWLWSLYRKLDVHTRSDAAVRAQQLGLPDG